MVDKFKCIYNNAMQIQTNVLSPQGEQLSNVIGPTANLLALGHKSECQTLSEWGCNCKRCVHTTKR